MTKNATLLFCFTATLLVMAFVGLMVYLTGDSHWAWAFLVLPLVLIAAEGNGPESSK